MMLGFSPCSWINFGYKRNACKTHIGSGIMDGGRSPCAWHILWQVTYERRGCWFGPATKVLLADGGMGETPDLGTITRLFVQTGEGQYDQLIPLTYEELLAIASARVRRGHLSP